MIQVRECLFETNSSSTHALTMCMDSDFKKWKDGELIYDTYEEKLIPYTEEIRKIKEEDDCKDFITYEEFNSGWYLDCETFVQKYTTPNGENVIGFGYFGYD